MGGEVLFLCRSVYSCAGHDAELRSVLAYCPLVGLRSHLTASGFPARATDGELQALALLWLAGAVPRS